MAIYCNSWALLVLCVHGAGILHDCNGMGQEEFEKHWVNRMDPLVKQAEDRLGITWANLVKEAIAFLVQEGEKRPPSDATVQVELLSETETVDMDLQDTMTVAEVLAQACEITGCNLDYYTLRFGGEPMLGLSTTIGENVEQLGIEDGARISLANCPPGQAIEFIEVVKGMGFVSPSE